MRANEKPDIMILSCASVGSGEWRLISEAQKEQLPFVVLCSALSTHLMRELFLAEATDVALKPYDEFGLVDIVEHAVDSRRDSTVLRLR
jgi:hypothetical protein